MNKVWMMSRRAKTMASTRTEVKKSIRKYKVSIQLCLNG